ncbi:MAG: GntR family transcriptional regulator [Lautropia sp.]
MQERTQRPAFAWSPNPDSPALSLPEQIAESVGNAVIGGTLPPGGRIHEHELSEQFAVSRGPVREALRILERDGLVEILPRRGARVTALAADEVDAVFELRSALMGVAAARVARERVPAEIAATLRSRIDQLRVLARDSDADAYVRAVYEINLMLVDACSNRFLRSIFFSLAHRTLRYSRLGLSTPGRRLQSARKRRRLYDAIDAGDGVSARQLGEALVIDSRDHAVALLAADSTKLTEGSFSDAKGPDREPRRNRLPDRPQLPRARTALGRSPL